MKSQSNDQKREIDPGKRMDYFKYQEYRLDLLQEIRTGIGRIIHELERRRTDDQVPIDTRIFSQAERYASELVRVINEIASKRIETE